MTYLILAGLVSLMLGWLALRTMKKEARRLGRRRATASTIIMSIVAWGFLSYVCLSFAISSTDVGKTSGIIQNMERNSPFKAIAQHDTAERDRLRTAVARGVAKAGKGDVEGPVMEAVSAELQPYLNHRFSQAPDSVYRAFAPIVVEAILKSDMVGPCQIPGDRNIQGLIRSLDPHKIMEWSDLLISTPGQNAPHFNLEENAIKDVRSSLVARGVASGTAERDAWAAVTPNATSERRCHAAATMIRNALTDPQKDRGGRDIRMLLGSFVLPG